MPDLGPFSVHPKQVEGLDGGGFADLAGRVLAAEIARAGLAGVVLSQTYRANAADGGVDAGLSRVGATTWLPEGESAWQFKAGNLGPSGCATELKGASAALEVLRRGGSYRLVLGKSLTPRQIADRKTRLEKTARELGIEVTAGTIEVLGADALARWIEDFPAVASSPAIRGIGMIGQTFEEWSASAAHTSTWVPSDTRDMQIADLRSAIESGEETGVHIEGLSGLGKTRMVMEALRGHGTAPLVVYVPSDDQFPPHVLSVLQTQGRSAVVVIDECDAKRHDTYAAMLQVGTSIRLVTISEPSQRTSRAASLILGAFEDGPLTELLERNQPTLWPEATRVIVEVSAGNIDYALKCAKALVAQRSAFAGELVSPADIRQFITDELPGGALFLASSVLALFSRIGFVGDLSGELRTVSEALSVSEADLRGAAAQLAAKGLLTTQGRYRSVGPSPVAIYLASSAWQELGPQIVDDLVPALNEDMVERLFARAAQIGDASLTSAVVDRMLAEDGPLGSLQALAQDRHGRLLDHLAVLAPRRVSRRISELLGKSTPEELESTRGVRRTLVWALQKLAWHSETFEEAADSLLVLATAENETYANNSTGVWVELFGTMLPATSTTPPARIAYLRKKASSDDDKVRALVVSAARRALAVQESTIVSGELQGGVVVEPRGVPKTWGDVWQYKNAMIDMLGSLAADTDTKISRDAVDALVRAIHGVLGSEPVQGNLSRVFLGLTSQQLQPIRAELANLRSLFGRNDDETARVGDVDTITAALPEQSLADQLWVLTHASPWHRRHVDTVGELLDIVSELPAKRAVAELMEVITEDVFVDFNVGMAIGRLGALELPDEEQLLERFKDSGSRALVGYLLAMDEQKPGVYDDFVDSLAETASTTLALTVQGPPTPRSEERVVRLLPRVSVAEGARTIFYWLRGVSDEEVVRGYLDQWVPRIETQADYNAVVDFTALYLHQRAEVSGELETTFDGLVGLRARFPELGQQEYDWSVLAERQLEREPEVLVATLVDLVQGDAVSVFSESREQDIFRRAVESAGGDVWISLMERLALRSSWKLSFATRGWLANAVDIGVVRNWVGNSKDRARIVASVASVGEEDLSAPVVFLLDNFGDEEDVTSPLVSEFVSGGWTGNESARIRRQISQVKRWLTQPEQSEGVRRWCRKLIDYLESDLGDVEQREQERAW